MTASGYCARSTGSVAQVKHLVVCFNSQQQPSTGPSAVAVVPEISLELVSLALQGSGVPSTARVYADFGLHHFPGWPESAQMLLRRGKASSVARLAGMFFKVFHKGAFDQCEPPRMSPFAAKN